ncbi:MAG: hypothetical protein KDD94_09245 [Calditrichaeota bacterium]|nr:hypothetical protein [Calditrichota bacterium]
MKFIISLFIISSLFAQRQLINATGKYMVGTHIWQWETPFEDQLTDKVNDKRTLVVQAWYPAQAASDKIADYGKWVSNYQGFYSHSYDDAEINRSIRSAHLIVIAPGRGTERFFYTMLAEEFASHGYIVISIDIPHTGDVTYESGERVPPNQKYKPPSGLLTGPYEKVDEFFVEAVTLGARDIAFALKKIEEENARFFKGKLDMSRMGLYGHSLGGRIGGQAVADDPRFKAFITMEAVAPRDIRRNGMSAAVVMCLSKAIVPYAIFNIGEVVPLRKSDTYIIILDKFGHNSMTDIPVLDPNAYNYEVDPHTAMKISRELLLRFFDQYVDQKKIKLSEYKNDLVEIDYFSKKR